MKTTIDYLAALPSSLTDLFYVIAIRKRGIDLQGHQGSKTITAIKECFGDSISFDVNERGYLRHTHVDGELTIEITLT